MTWSKSLNVIYLLLLMTEDCIASQYRPNVFAEMTNENIELLDVFGTQTHTEVPTSAPWRALLYPSSTVSMREPWLSRNMQWEFLICRSQVRNLFPVTAVDVPPSSRKGRSFDRKYRWYCNSGEGFKGCHGETDPNSDRKAYQCLWWHPVLSSCTGSHRNLQHTHTDSSVHWHKNNSCIFSRLECMCLYAPLTSQFSLL